MASNKYFYLILWTHLLLLTLTQCWSIIPGAIAGYKMSIVLLHMHGMRQILLFLYYSKPTPTKSSLLLMPVSTYPSIDNYLLLPLSQPMLLVLSPCSLHALPLHTHSHHQHIISSIMQKLHF